MGKISFFFYHSGPLRKNRSQGPAHNLQSHWRCPTAWHSAKCKQIIATRQKIPSIFFLHYQLFSFLEPCPGSWRFNKRKKQMFNVSCDYIFFKVFFLGRNSLMPSLRILFQNACGYPLWALARIFSALSLFVAEKSTMFYLTNCNQTSLRPWKPTVWRLSDFFKSLHVIAILVKKFCKDLFHVFRAIFDLSNKIALLILLRMFALYVKKKRAKNWKLIEEWYF